MPLLLQTVDFRPVAPPSSRTPRFSSEINSALLFVLIFAGIFALHAPLLNLPYYWDEAGYFVPAARDLLLTGDPIPQNTLSNAHPPLVMIYLALCWKLFGESFVVTRGAMLTVAAFALVGVFRLAQRVANNQVAAATILCTALYPVFFAQSSLAHLDMAAAAFTIWGLSFCLPSRTSESATTGSSAIESAKFRQGASIAMFALAALAKETAILTPLALLAWEILCRWVNRMGRGRASVLKYCHEPRRHFITSLALLLSLVPLALWFAYHYFRTGHIFGNPEFFRYNVESALTPGHVLFAAAGRLWHVTGHMNLFLLTLAAALAMWLRPVRDEGEPRRRIEVPTQMVFAVVIVAHAVALSLIGGAVLARYMLPVLPLVILICVSTIWRRARRWRSVLAVVCAGFVLALFVNPPHRFPWEENLAYRDFVTLHRRAARVLSANYTDSRVLTAWPASDELRWPYLGYVERPLAVVPIEHFSIEKLTTAMRAPSAFNVVLLFSTNYHQDLRPEVAAELLGGRIIFYEERNNQWVAIIERDG